MGVVSEFRRRNVFRMAVLYVVAAWAVMQAAEVLIGLANLPDWVGPTTLTVLAVGFPIALVFSWFFEVTPEGLALEKEVPSGQSITRVTGRRMDFVIIAILLAGLLLFAYDKWWIGPPPEQSIAVLPFANLSDDPQQEYFSDGISEDILNLLASVPELSVISRSSSFSFKDRDLDIPAIAERLNVAHILEGSVRKSGNQLRVTAQLIDVETNMQIWSQTYDRDLQNVFAIQDDIAISVVGALKIALLGQEIRSTETSPDAYALYLQGRFIDEHGGKAEIVRAESLLEQALSLDPGFAPAWVELGFVLSMQAIDSSTRLQGRTRDEARELAFAAIRQALKIDPLQGRAYAALGQLEMYQTWDFTAAGQHIQRALALSPSDTYVLRQAAQFEAMMGRHDKVIELCRQMIQLDPVQPHAHKILGYWLYRVGRMGEAADSFALASSLEPNRPPPIYSGLVLLAQGNRQGALAVMEETEITDIWRLWGMAIVKHALEDRAASEVALQELIEKYNSEAAVQIAEIYAYRGQVDDAFYWLDQAYDDRDAGLLHLLADPLFIILHDDPRWLALLEKMGLPHH